MPPNPTNTTTPNSKTSKQTKPNKKNNQSTTNKIINPRHPGMLGPGFILVPRLVGSVEPVSPFPPLNSANGGAGKTGSARGGWGAAPPRGSRAGSGLCAAGFPAAGEMFRCSFLWRSDGKWVVFSEGSSFCVLSIKSKLRVLQRFVLQGKNKTVGKKMRAKL